ncbi:MAG TPA: alpha/beta hydrolase fold domain-containing protein, partial [Dehalococcoidia bacterium]|nr:alpha/beta hydrolase fold domain-containing protein [Dehalococcoidia bacterium]
MAERPAIPPSVELLEDVEFGTGGGRPLRMHIVRPRRAPSGLMPVVVYVHGGWWRAGSRDTGLPRLIPLAERGYFGAAVEYRLTGEAQWPAQIQDCKCGIRYLRTHAAEYGIDAERIGVWGASAGGHLVAMLGSAASVPEFEGDGGWPEQSSAVQAVCDWFGPTDLRLLGHDNPDSHSARLIGGPVKDNLEAATNASPVTYVSAGSAPHLLQHGTEDAQVPVGQSELLHAALQKAGADSTLHTFPGLGHEYLGDDAIADAHAFFENH